LGRTVVVLALIITGFVVLYLILKKKIERRTDPSAALSEIRDEVDRIIVELNQTTDRNITLIEDKLAALGEKLAVADRKIALLQKESEKNELSSQVYSNILQKRAETRPEPQAEDAHEQVLRMHLSGVSPAAIAKRLGRPLAEIELIISLSARRR
jgi:hypothetical protein